MKTHFILTVVLLFFVPAQRAASQPRIGVLLPGGVQYEIVEGLRQGLKELGLEENKQFTLALKDIKVDASLAEKEAKAFERENVSLIYALTTTVITNAKAATSEL